MLQICSKILHGISTPSSFIQLTPTQSLMSAQKLSCPAGTCDIWALISIYSLVQVPRLALTNLIFGISTKYPKTALAKT